MKHKKLDTSSAAATLRAMLAGDDPSGSASAVIAWACTHLVTPERLVDALRAALEADMDDVALWRAVATLALYPRARHLNASLREMLEALLGEEGDWRSEASRRGGVALARDFGLAGFTASGASRGVDFFRAALLEEAMLCGQRWPLRRWSASVLPAFASIPVLWGGFDASGALVVASRDADAIGRAQVCAVGVPHLLELGAAGPCDTSEDPEPFAQVRRWVSREVPERGRRLDRSLVGVEIEDTVLFVRLRSRGWRRGTIMDTQDFTELHRRWDGRGDRRAFIRFFPGVPANGPEGRMVTIAEAGFVDGSMSPPWGRYGDSNVEDLGLRRGSKPDRWAEHRVGLRLEDVDVVVRSEARRTLLEVLRVEEDALLPYSGLDPLPAYAPQLMVEPFAVYRSLCVHPDISNEKTRRAVSEVLATRLTETIEVLRGRWRAEGCALRRPYPRPSRGGLSSPSAWAYAPPTLLALWPILPLLDLFPTRIPPGWPDLEQLSPLSLFGVLGFGGEILWPRTPKGGRDVDHPIHLDVAHHLDPWLYREGAPVLLSDGEHARLIPWLRQILLEQGGMGMSGVMPEVVPDLLERLTEGLPGF